MEKKIKPANRFKDRKWFAEDNKTTNSSVEESTKKIKPANRFKDRKWFAEDNKK